MNEQQGPRLTKEQCKVCEGLCCGEIPRLNAEIERQQAEIRALDQANGGALQENERLRSELAVSRRLRSAHNAVVDSLFAHQEADTQPNKEEKDRLMAEWQEAERAFKAEVISDEPVKP